MLMVLLSLLACPPSPKESGNETENPVDADGDGADSSLDCNDGDASVFPGAAETCDGKDNNCNSEVDDQATDASTSYADADGDTYGDANAPTVACSVPAGNVSDNRDCNDADAAIHPDAAEVCDGLDNNCLDGVDEGVLLPWYSDGDGDGYGTDGNPIQACDQPSGTASQSGDCDDTDPSFHPGAAETCTDEVDYNCDGSVARADLDGDGYAACEDCNDRDAKVNPAATEVCDRVDNDCSGTADDNAIDESTFYTDSDGDGYGDRSSPVQSCFQMRGTAAKDGDCNDRDGLTYPGGYEYCDSVDNDCNGLVDDNPVKSPTWYTDADGDGYGDTASAVVSCTQPAGTVGNGGDCDDANSKVNPGATEDTTDLIDNDCDGQVDEVTVTLAEVQAIFDTSCTSCHSGKRPSAGLDLSSGITYKATVNMPSTQSPKYMLIAPYDSANSYLWAKVNNTQLNLGGSGSQMPSKGALLSASDLTTLENWILDGAQP